MIKVGGFQNFAHFDGFVNVTVRPLVEILDAKKLLLRSLQMEARNQLVREAAGMLERVHGVNNATSAREMAQEGLVRRARRAPGPGHKPRPTSQGGLGPIQRRRVMGGLLHTAFIHTTIHMRQYELYI